MARVDRFLETEIEARALALALAEGWIDRLVEAAQRRAMLGGGKWRERELALFLSILTGAGVVEPGDPVRLTPAFRAVLPFRDLLEAKLWFATLVGTDVHENLEALLTDTPAFMRRARTFELFRYDRCLAVTPENLAATRRWLRYTTVLTRYEAPAALNRIALDGTRHMLDVGGNSGEFARQACLREKALSATVFDLPVVCALGREHLAKSEAAGRVHFTEGDLRRDELPQGHDLVTFKSVLHDWPDEPAAAFLSKAAEALAPGGRIAIFERAPVEPATGRIPFSMVANLVFLPFFRDPDFYCRRLAALGFEEIARETVRLEMPFVLITARKPSR
ncbi:MAG: methyltransferase domain-containing protein [Methylobacterium mesophilicum]|nr:methyltransferase domain-containing protein [Methylobacterium mesophilicum]